MKQLKKKEMSEKELDDSEFANLKYVNLDNANIKFVQGIPLTRIGKLAELFIKEGFDLRNNQDWKEIKRHFFNITEKDLI